MDRLIENDKWMERLPGKEILRKFLEQFSTSGLNMDSFVRTATSIIRNNAIEVPELARLKEVIGKLQGII